MPVVVSSHQCPEPQEYIHREGAFQHLLHREELDFS
jgi:hypothetical protein